jgi:stage II sporulation SpoAA-like protein
MIELIKGLPENVVGVVVKGRVTRKDCAEILVPAIEKAREWHHKLRLYYEIRSRYPGAAWEEITLGIEHPPAWERVAIVADAAWIRHTVTALRLLIPSEIRVFATDQVPEGLAWVTSGASQRRRYAPAPLVRVAGSRPFRPPEQYLNQAF